MLPRYFLGLIGLYFPEYAINIIVLVKIFSVAINRFLQRISQDGGLASSNNFVVKFMNPPFGMPNGLDEAMEFYCNEAQLPNLLPEAYKTNFSIFLDSGNVWGVDYSSTVDDTNTIRSSAGIALDWHTPVGPLSFSYAGVLSKASSDKIESFRFNLGTTF